MASIFKPTYSAKDPKTGKTIQRKTKKWYGQYRDENGVTRRVPLCTDKAAAQAMLNEIVKRVERGEAGLTSPYDQHRKRPIEGHLEDFERHLANKGTSPKQVKLTLTRIRKIIKGCKVQKIPDIRVDVIETYLSEQELNGLSERTRNFYARAIKHFTRWLVKFRRNQEDPLSPLSATHRVNTPRRSRRVISSDELESLIQSTMQSQAVYRGLTGEDRAFLYLVASNTGLRASELASLKTSSFELAEGRNLVVVEAAYSKRRRRDEQPIPTRLVAELRHYLGGKRPGSVVWPGSWNEKAAKMLRGDLKEAGLEYETGAGVFDFHALRHYFVSNLSRGGVHPKMAQKLARHSDINLTMNTYTHVELEELTKELDRQSPVSKAPLQNNFLALELVQDADISCPEVSATVQPENEIVESTVFPSVYGCGTYDIGWPVVTMSGQARPGGLEPPTCGLEDRCSIQLSYGRKGLWGHKFY
ncbi:hypothetical protein GCM10023155_10030 [Bremerella cremea]